MARVKVKPPGFLTRAADRLCNPMMRILMEMNGAVGESPQLTHWWNNLKLRRDEAELLDQSIMATVEGDPLAWRLSGLLRHMPLIGWQQYAVVAPVFQSEIEWYPGWHTADEVGVSRLRQRGPVKLLRGPEAACFFGLDLSGRQLQTRVLGYGQLGYAEEFFELPLL